MVTKSQEARPIYPKLENEWQTLQHAVIKPFYMCQQMILATSDNPNTALDLQFTMSAPKCTLDWVLFSMLMVTMVHLRQKNSSLSANPILCSRCEDPKYRWSTKHATFISPFSEPTTSTSNVYNIFCQHHICMVRTR